MSSQPVKVRHWVTSLYTWLSSCSQSLLVHDGTPFGSWKWPHMCVPISLPYFQAIEMSSIVRRTVLSDMYGIAESPAGRRGGWYSFLRDSGSTYSAVRNMVIVPFTDAAASIMSRM